MPFRFVGAALRSTRLLLGVLVGSAAGLSIAAPPEPVELLRSIDRGFTALFQKVAPCVVVIEARRNEDDSPDGAERAFDFFFGERSSGTNHTEDPTQPRRPLHSEGSGIVLRADGYIVTNRHVIAGAQSIEVRSYDQRLWEAKVVATDERTDIAVIKVEGTALSVASLADSDALKVGQLVGAIGAPFDQDFSFSVGWVSGLGRTNLLAGSTSRNVYEDYIQTDAFINPGNSGGPLFDVDGRVVGMNTLINGLGRGLAFAIPSNLLRDVADELIAKGKVRRPWLGVRVIPLTASRNLRAQIPASVQGVVVSTVEAGGPASEGDLQPGDVITTINTRPLHTPHDLVRQIRRMQPSQTVRLEILRQNQPLTVSVTVGELPEEDNGRSESER